MRTAFLLITAVALQFNAWGQDVIFTRAMQTIHGKILLIGTETTQFIPTEYPDGPAFEIENEQIYRITLHDERIFNFDREKLVERKLRAATRSSQFSDPLPQTSSGIVKNKGINKQNIREAAWSFGATYNLPRGDFSTESTQDGDRADAGYGAYFSWSKGVFPWLNIGADAQWETYRAVFDTSLFGLDVGGLGFLNISIASGNWQSGRLGVSVSTPVYRWKGLELTLGAKVGAWALLEPKLNASANLFIITTEVSNTPAVGLAPYYGGNATVQWQFSKRWALTGQIQYVTAAMNIQSEIQVVTAGQPIPESRTTAYRLNVIQPSIGLSYRLR